ncbi:MAG: glycosyltransferase family 4 protein [Gemmatimonadota bacterium]|nr:glycosyltransferase family 4 protein [Gemmatimonadota bacterium]
MIDARMVRTSGIGTYIEHLVPRIVTLWSDAQFTILGDQDVLAREIPPSPRVRYREFNAPIYSLREQLAYLRLVPRDAMLWVPHYNIPLLRRGALAVTVHDVFHLAAFDMSPVRRCYARVVFGTLVRRARVVICDSAFTAGELQRLAGKPHRMAVVHLGVSPRWSALSATNPPLEGPYLLAVGNVKPHKNLKRLVAAFERVSRDIPHRLVIVGRREGLLTLDTEVEQMAERLGDRVVFTGYVTRDVLERYVACCAALIQPSLYEGFGLPPLEAMAAGRPVAVSRAGSLPEVCGPEADYFDPTDVDSIGDALKRCASLVDGPEKQMRRRAWAARFDWDIAARETHAVLAVALDATETSPRNRPGRERVASC